MFLASECSNAAVRAHRPPEDAGGRPKVEGATLGVGVVPLLLELHVLHLVANHWGGEKEGDELLQKEQVRLGICSSPHQRKRGREILG